MFFADEGINELIERVEKAILFKVLVFWFPMYLLCSVIYFCICLAFITVISRTMVKPINELT